MKKNVITEKIVVSNCEFFTKEGVISCNSNGSSFIRILGYNEDDLEVSKVVPMVQLRGAFGNVLKKDISDVKNLENFKELAVGKCLAWVQDVFEIGDEVELVGELSEKTIEKVKIVKENTYMVIKDQIVKNRLMFARDTNLLKLEIQAKETALLEFKAKQSVATRPVVQTAPEPKDKDLVGTGEPVKNAKK